MHVQTGTGLIAVIYLLCLGFPLESQEISVENKYGISLFSLRVTKITKITFNPSYFLEMYIILYLSFYVTCQAGGGYIFG